MFAGLSLQRHGIAVFLYLIHFLCQGGKIPHKYSLWSRDIALSRPWRNFDENRIQTELFILESDLGVYRQPHHAPDEPIQARALSENAAGANGITVCMIEEFALFTKRRNLSM